MNKQFLNQKGQSILEIVTAMAIFVLLAAALASLLLGSFVSLERGGDFTRAQALAREGMEAVRAVRDRAWNELIYSHSALAVDNGQWILTGEGASEQINKFIRVIDFEPIYRDSEGEIVLAGDPGACLDALSKLVKVNVRWEILDGVNNNVSQICYLSGWRSRQWTQSDWSAGSGQEILQDSDKYGSDDGNINIGLASLLSLAELATSTYAAEGWLISSAFDSEGQNAFNAISWTEELLTDCLDCAIKAQIKTAPDLSGLPGAWSETWCGPSGENGDEDDYFSVLAGKLISMDHNGDQWIKYKITLFGNASSTPELSEIKIFYQ